MKRKRFWKRPATFLSALVIVLLSCSFGPVAALGTNASQPNETPGEPLPRIATDFEDGTAQGWRGRGGVESLTVTAAAAHSGEYGLHVAGRTQGWHGPLLDLTDFVQSGKTYAVAAWVRLPAGLADSPVSILVQRQTDGSSFYESVNTKTANDVGWVKLSGEYTLHHSAEFFGVYLESFEHPTLDFYVDDVLIEQIPDPEPIEIEHNIPSLKDVFAGDFLLGSALLVNEIVDPEGPEAELLKKHFNSLTAGNELKWDATEPSEGRFEFARADRIVGFADENGIASRGHTLIWHAQTPNWVFYDEDGNLAGKELLFERMKRHIETVVGRYKGKIYAWDVVNEVIEPSDRQPGGLRNSLWYQIAGEEFIEKAFEYAHAADPDAKLYINDYNTHQPVKRQFLHDLIKRLQDKGIPVHGVGHQTHISIEYPLVQEIDDMLQAFRGLGIEQQITELDMSVYSNDSQSYDTFPRELQIKQANKYKAIFDVFKAHADQLTAVIFWGKDDLNTWLRTFPVARNNWPLLFDERLQAKFAYWALVDPGKVPVETKYAEAASGSAIIDGKPDKAWSRAKSVPIMRGSQSIAHYKAMWEEGRLFVMVDVADSSENGNDAVEVFIDGNNGKTEAYEADDKKYTFRRSGANPHKPALYKAVDIDGGYRIEASIPIEDAALGKEVGFDIRIVDRTGHAVTKTSWNDSHNMQDANTSNYGVLTLVEGPRFATAAKGTPVVDGIIDSVWDSAETITTDRLVSGSGGATALVRVLWDESNLYVLAEVTDSLLTKRSANTWEQDSIEIFVDPNNAKSDVYESDDGQYRINFDNETSVNPDWKSGNLVSAATRTDTGYIVEAAIAWPDELPQAGDWIGFDVQVNDDADDNGIRDSIAIWNDISGQSWRSMSGLGIIQLKD